VLQAQLMPRGSSLRIPLLVRGDDPAYPPLPTPRKG
jgi:hypothetical protein